MASPALQKFSDFFTYFLDRYKPAILTLLVLAGGYYFYFNVIVSENEAELKERSFRGLNRMAANLSGKISDYTRQNADNFLKAYNASLNAPLQRSPALLRRDYGLDVWTQKLKDSSSRLSVGLFNGWKLFFRSNNNDSVAYADVKEFVMPHLRRDLFSHYLFTAGDTVLFDELNLSSKSRADFLPAKNKPDTTKNGAVQAGETYTLGIGGREYKLFLLSFIVEGKQRFSIGGYMPLDKYMSEQRYIPTYAMIWMVIGLLLVLLMFPLLKIFLMQRSEQLLARNAVASLAAVHITGAVVVLITLNVYVYFTFVIPAADKNLKDLATDTKNLFSQELDSALHEMKAVENAVNTQPTLFTDRVLRLPNKRTGGVGDTTSANGFAPGNSYPYFAHIAWANDTGQQVVRWTTKSYLPQKIDVGGRDYFEAVKTGNLWKRGEDTFYLTAVSSWVSKEKLTVIAKPFRGQGFDSLGKAPPAMMSMSGSFRSLFNTALPQGYGFCLVRDNGDVLFHADPTRSLNENLVEESGNDEALLALLATRSAGFVGARYSGSSHRFYVMPVAGLPLSVVTFRDMKVIWSEDLDVISACSILCLMNLAVILLAILIIQIGGYRHSLLQNQTILFTWLRPNRQLSPAYRSVCHFFMLSMLLQVGFFFLYSGEDLLCLVAIAFSYSYLLICYMYFQFAIVHIQDDRQRHRNKRPLPFLVGFYLFTTALMVITLRSGNWYFVLSQAVLIGIGLALYYFPQLQRTFFTHRNFRWWYISSLFAAVAATGIIPILIFYCLSFKEERLLSLKHNQLQFAQRLVQMPADTLAPAPQVALTPGLSTPFHFRSFAKSIGPLEQPDSLPHDSVDGFERLYQVIKPAFSVHSREIEHLIRNQHQTGEDFFWQHRADDSTVRFYYTVPRPAALFRSPGLTFHSILGINWKDTGHRMAVAWDKTLLLVFALLLLLKGFEFLLKRLVQRIFFEGYDDTARLTESDLRLLEALPENENIFINGPINSGKHAAIVKALRDKKIQLIEKDVAELNTKDASAMAADIETEARVHRDAGQRFVVLIRHFELCLHDPKMTEKKLLLLEALLSQKQQIILLSSRSVESMPLGEAAENGDVSDSFTDRWSNALNQFYNLYHHWRRPGEDTPEEKKQLKVIQRIRETLWVTGNMKIEEAFSKKKPSPKLEDAEQNVKVFLLTQINDFLWKVNQECAHSDFLWSLRPALFNFIETQKDACLRFDFQDASKRHMRQVISRHFTTQFEQVCLRIQSLAANYYLAIWRSLSRDEQRTLFDIGMDDLVNPGNRVLATKLANLGLVTPEDNIACYQVMNRSFRNFIFTQLHPKEVQTLQADRDEKGSWASFQLPVLTVVISLAVFLFATQKDAFTNLVTYLGAAAGGIAALLKVLGMIPSTKT